MKKKIFFVIFLLFLSPLEAFHSQFVPYEKAPKPLNLDYSQFPYPDCIKKLGIVGTLYLQLRIDTSGNVTNVILIHTLHPELDISAVEEAGNLKFIPATQRDKKVAVWLAFPVAYKPEESIFSKDTLTYFDILNSNGKVSDTLNLPFKLTLKLLNKKNSIDIDTTVFIPEEVIYPEITNSEDFIASKSRERPSGSDISIIYVEILLDEKGVPLKYILKNPATKDLDSLALKTAKSLKFTPAKYHDKPIHSRFLIRLIFEDVKLGY